MRNISDLIEEYLSALLAASENDAVEIKRSELAERFECVPSQINYVISTRFTIEKGYLVESKRGGGGYIRICKVDLVKGGTVHKAIVDIVGSAISQREAEGLIHRLAGDQLVTGREARMMTAAVDREVLPIPIPLRDQVRAKVLSAMLMALIHRHP